MVARSSEYVNRILQAIDNYITDNLSYLRACDLSEFYKTLFKELKEFFGGSWGFDGVTEVLIFRTLHHIIGEKAKIIKITNDLNAFYYEGKNIVLGAGLPLQINNEKIWPDIIVYIPYDNNPRMINQLVSILEIKAYPQGGLKGLKNTINRLKIIHNHYKNPKSALIIYDVPVKDKKRSKMWKYLHKELSEEELIPDYIDVIILAEHDNKVIDLFKPYVSL
ncbi:hypothetical protein J4526_07545 [Desulfurococcaceae archaeon MEX13E-LK6-19]|nr:hypothetical protein J4526_07545 [Desulfurococcaceae archaeon MEX13E-LK6-19]